MQCLEKERESALAGLSKRMSRRKRVQEGSYRGAGEVSGPPCGKELVRMPRGEWHGGKWLSQSEALDSDSPSSMIWGKLL